MLEGISEQVLGLGFQGIVIVVLAIVIKKLWEDIKARETKCEVIQEKRIEEAKQAFGALIQNADALNTLSALIRERK